MFFSLSQQTVCFLASVAFGAALAALYDLVRAVRMLLRASCGHIVVSDILFFFVCGVLTSLFALPFNKGDVRGFAVFGEAAGFLTYRLTLGSVFGKIYAVIARLLRHIIRKICEKLKKIYDFLLKAGALLLYNISVLIERFGRTALSGIRILTGELRTACADRRSARIKRRSARRAERTPAVPSGEADRIPIIPGRPLQRQYIDRKDHEQKRVKTRKSRKN